MIANRVARVLAVALSAAASLVASAQEVQYEKYTLPNGMVVILHEDHSLPVATINTWFRVGAQDEPPGRSGFAHLFEHLMFMGTKRVPGNQFDVLMETGGGANNASTDLHRTNYYSWGPSKLLPTLLWLDADRLEDMGLQMTIEKLDKQRDVVRNELRQSVENAPYQKAGEALFKLLYTPDHPYYYGVIGTHEDLEAANVTNVKDFFANFYVPNNASLVVAGDFKSADIKPLVNSLFGTLPAGQDVVRKYEKPAEHIPGKLAHSKRFTAIDKVEQPKVEFTWHSAVAFGEGDAELDLAAAVLARGKASRLYKRLVIDEKLAADVSAAQQGYPLGGMFQVAVYAKPTADLARVEKIMDEEIAKFVKDGPTAEELDKNKATIELGMLASLQSIERKADKMNEYEYYLGEPNSFKRDLDRYRNAKPEQVRNWASRVVKQNRIVIHVLPEEPEREPSTRDTRPPEMSQGTFTLPTPQSFTASNGLKVHVWTKKELPLVALRLVVQPGGPLDVENKQGLASLTADMMGEGAGDLDALAFETAVQSIGATFNSGADRETIGVSMTVLKRSLDRGAELFSDAVQHPRFDSSEWDRVKTLAIEDIKQSLEVPGTIAGRVGNRLLFGETNPYGWSTSGTVESVNGIQLNDIKSTHAALVNPSVSTLLIAGDVTLDEAKSLVEKNFASWRAAPFNRTQPAADALRAQPRNALHVALVDRPGATQTMIRFYAPGVRHGDESRVRRELLNTILGGSFTSRLNANLREEKGYTYGARSGFAMGISAGSFSAAASVKADTTGESLAEFMKEFERIKAGDVSDDEAAKARETLRNDTVRGFQGLSGLLGAAEEQLVNGLPFDTVTKDLDEMGKAKAADLNSLAGPALPVMNGVLVLVGDKKTILDEIKGLNLPTPVEYTTDGELLAK